MFMAGCVLQRHEQQIRPCITPLGDTLYFDKMASANSVEMWRVTVAATLPDPHHLYLPQVIKQP